MISSFSISSAAFLVALVAPVFILLALASAVSRRVRNPLPPAAWIALLLVSLTVHPMVQPMFLEGVDTRRGQELARRATDAGIVGMSMEDVRKLLGEPAVVVANSSGSQIWEYKQLPIYWLGSHFQVFFERGSVRGFEANDD